MRNRNGVLARMLAVLALLVAFIGAPVHAEVAPPTTETSPHPFVPPLNPPAARPSASKQAETKGPRVAEAVTIISDPVLDMKVLVLHRPGDADGVFAMVKSYLEILGIPYLALDTSQAAPGGTIEASDLWDGAHHGYYYAVFVTTSNIWAALSAAEQTTISDYERNFNVRHVTWYAFPNPADHGLTFTAVTAANNDATWCPGTPQGIPFTASLTSAGQATFGYLRPDLALSIEGPCMYGYLAQPAAGADVTPLLTDAAGDTFLAVFRPGDGREHMVMTEGSFYPAIPPAYLHAQVLPYGIINWATRGVFLGQRRVYFVPQPDDVLSWGDRWDVITHSYIYNNGYRNEPADLDNLVAWQNSFRLSTPNAADFRIEMPFNGEGVRNDEDGNGQILPGTLSAKAIELQNDFTWLNHTFTHRDMDIDENPLPDYQISYDEIDQNNQTAARLGLADYSTTTLLTGDYSGISTPGPNPDLAQAAYDLGVRAMLVNASLPAYSNPTPNTGIPHPTQPAILQTPRYANNIFYAVTSPEEEVDLYNSIYCPGYAAAPDTTPRCYDYNYILDSVTSQALRFMLDYSVNANMFHMNNLDDYGGGKTVLTDFVEALYGKYNALFTNNVPVLSLRTQDITQTMRDRMAYNASGVSGELSCGNQITLRTVADATIPVTGVSYGVNVSTYAGQPTSYVAMGANATVVIPGEDARTPAAITGLTATQSGADVVLNWPAVTQATDGNPLGVLAYRVYARANDPNFTPTLSDLLAEISGTALTYTHVNGAIPGSNYNYVVTSVGDNCEKLESALSNRVQVVSNRAPVADDQSVMVAQATATSITLGGSDPDGDTLTYRIVNGPANGSLTALGTGLLTEQASADTWVNAKSSGTNYGSNPTFRISKAGGSLGDNRGLVRFSLPALPAGAAIDSANMVLNQLNGGSGSGSLAMQARRINSSWDESIVTYSTIPAVNGSSSGTTTAPTNVVGEYAWNLTTLVRSWYSTTPNHGVLLGDTNGGSDMQVYATREDASGKGPRLVIRYSGAAIPSLIYTPVVGYSGADSFTFVVNDGKEDSAPATVSFTVNEASDVIFKDGFEAGDLSAWSSSATNGGALSVDASAALVGGQGLRATINNNTSMSVTDDRPNAESRYRARFYFDPNSITMANANDHFIFYGYSGASTVVLRMQLRFSSSAYQIRAGVLDGNDWWSSSWFTISDAPHMIEFDWLAATQSGVSNGYLKLWIDGTQRANLTGVNNSSRRIDRVSLGPVAGIDTGTRGAYYFDAFESRRQTAIGTASQ